MEGPEYDRSKRLFYPALNFFLLANTLALVVQQFALLWVVLELTTFSPRAAYLFFSLQGITRSSGNTFSSFRSDSFACLSASCVW
jgi:formate hydrogenlyase subunit 3/multisubunit Na+/H+ antiporter MnhD subunit